MKLPSALLLLSILLSSLTAAEKEPAPEPSPQTPPAAEPAKEDQEKDQDHEQQIDPFTAKFGGPYPGNEKVAPEFRKTLLELGSGLKSAFGSLGMEGLKDKEGFDGFCKDFIDPTLDKLKPRTNEEKKLKEAAIYVKKVHAFIVDPRSFPEAERNEMQAFLKASILPADFGIPMSDGTNPERIQADQFGGVLIRFSGYASGMGFEEYRKLFKDLMKKQKAKAKDE